MLIFRELLNLSLESCNYICSIFFPYFWAWYIFKWYKWCVCLFSWDKNQRSDKAPSLRVIPVNCACILFSSILLHYLLIAFLCTADVIWDVRISFVQGQLICASGPGTQVHSCRVSGVITLARTMQNEILPHFGWVFKKLNSN